jgi:nucleoside phosphorylase
MKLLFIASDPMEFRGLLAHATDVRGADVAARWSRLATLGGNEVLLAANGAGPDRAAAATDAGMKVFGAAAIVSTGFCGALAPELGIADLVSATSVASADRCYATRMWDSPPGASVGLGHAPPVGRGHALPASNRAVTINGAVITNGAELINRTAIINGPPQAPRHHAPRHFSGAIQSIPYVARTAEEKRNLAVTGAIAVEMEAAGIAARAKIHGLPFYCIRAVTDLAGETLANDFNKALRLDGHFDTILILKGTLRQPMVRLPELFRLRKRCVRAAHVLGDFFAYSRI